MIDKLSILASACLDCDPIWQVTPRSSEMSPYEELYSNTPLTFNSVLQKQNPVPAHCCTLAIHYNTKINEQKKECRKSDNRPATCEGSLDATCYDS